MKKKMILVVTLTILSIFIINESKTLIKTLTNANKVLEDVKISDILKNKDKTLSIMLQEDGDGTTFKEAESRDKWPDIASYIYDKAECTDSEGKSVDYKSILTFDLDKKTTTVKTKQTVYCTLYFVKGKETLTLLQSKAGFQEKSGMYRFVGDASTVKNNYICFGTTNQSDCTSNPNTYMYRIIGMTKTADDAIGLHAGQLKLIKAVPSNTSQVWHSSASSDVKWEASSVKSYLNTTFLDTIKNGSNGTYWNKLITSQNWYIQDQTSSPGATAEPTGAKTTTPRQVGLMYGTDYMNANGESSSNWLHITNGWSGNTRKMEWTMSRCRFAYGETSAWPVGEYGGLYNRGVADPYAIRPVFYLKSGILLTGDGTTTDPFRIAG